MGEAVTIYIIGHGEENIQVPFTLFYISNAYYLL